MGSNGITNVVVVGGGFAGVACAKRLAGARDVAVTLVDKNDYHQFQPLLYQVATAELTPRTSRSRLDQIFKDADNVDVRQAEVVSADHEAGVVTLADGDELSADVIVLAAGVSAELLPHSGRRGVLVPALLARRRGADPRAPAAPVPRREREPGSDRPGSADVRRHRRGRDGCRVGGSDRGARARDHAARAREPRGRERKGRSRRPRERRARAVLAGVHEYAAKQLEDRGVEIRLGISAKEIAPDHVRLSDGTTIKTHLVVWGGGLMAAPLGARAGVTQGKGGAHRRRARPDASAAPERLRARRLREHPSRRRGALPQLGSVAQQSGDWAAQNILADAQGKSRRAFEYKDKGIMAMIGRKAAVAEVGKHRHELKGRLAFAAWLGVHAQLLSNAGAELDAFLAWADDFYFGRTIGRPSCSTRRRWTRRGFSGSRTASLRFASEARRERARGHHG